MTIYELLEQETKRLHERGLYRVRRPLTSSQGPEINTATRKLFNFSSNDYLGLSNNEQIKNWMIGAVQEWGAGACASQMIAGHSIKHHELEHKLADWLQRDQALTFSSGYLANLAIASTLIDKATIVIQDKLNHASLIDAARLSRGRLLRYKHCDTPALKNLLDKHRHAKLIVMTDGVFSMDGDSARLCEIAELCTHYNALLIVDDAHGIGVLGRTGGGLAELLGVTQKQVPLLIGTFSKAFGQSGAFIAGDGRIIEYLSQKARTYIYTTALSPAITATLVNTVDLVVAGSELRKKLATNIQTLAEKTVIGPDKNSHIQPLVVGGNKEVIKTGEKFFRAGVLATAIRPPTVPTGTARLRISLSAAHSEHHISRLAAVINENASDFKK